MIRKANIGVLFTICSTILLLRISSSNVPKNLSLLLSKIPSSMKFKQFASSMNIMDTSGSIEMPGENLKGIIDLTKNVNLDKVTLYALFYLPNCPHCKEFMPLYDSSAQKANLSGSEDIFFKIDVNKYPKAALKYHFSMLPAVKVKLFVN